MVGEKAAATVESITPYARNGTWYGNGGKAVAIVESITLYARNGAGYDHRGKAAAVLESIIPDACNGVFCTNVCYLFWNIICLLSVYLGGQRSRFQKSGCSVFFIMVGEKAAASFVFANRFISEIYFLNGRKVVTLILQKTKNGKI